MGEGNGVKLYRLEWSWTNWTFGFWSGRIGKWRCYGVDLGPFEVVWRKPL